MKALILKDLYTLKESRLLVGLMMIIAIVLIMFSDQGITFAVSYVGMLSVMIVLNTISYDEANQGYAFLFTMPFSRKRYVQAKYIFGAVTVFISWGFVVAIIILKIAMEGYPVDVDVWRFRWAEVLGTLIFMQAVMIPIQMKFGGQKGRIALLVFFAAIIGAGVGLAGNATVQNILRFFVDMGKLESYLIGILGIFLVIGISYRCSVRIMEKKEF